MRTSRFILILICTTSFQCENKLAVENGPEFGTRKRLAELTNEKLQEVSGMAASITNDGLLWVLNDSGNPPEIYLIDENLNIKMTITLVGITNRDWEAIAVGPGPDPEQAYIYVGDIGDNTAIYRYKRIYRVPEPALSTSDHLTITDFETITFDLEDGIKDLESLFIDDKSKNLYVVSKRETPVYLYEITDPQNSKDTILASKILALPFSGIVAADYLHERGDILMKSYTHIYYWENKDELDVVRLLMTTPQQVTYEAEPLGETIAWTLDGSGFFTLSERWNNQTSYLYYYPSN